MCGIAGWIDREAAPIGPGVIDAMAGAIAHRGSRGAGRWDGVTRAGRWRVALAHRRFGEPAQPVVAEGGRAVLVADCQLVDTRELAAELGPRLAGASEPELLLAAYLAWGAQCVQRLRGQFAFAVWDGVEERLFLARDRFGEKPLYLWQDGQGAVAFGSEVKALLAHPHVPAALDRASVAEYLRWGYVPGPHTLFAGIHKLPPSAWAMWEAGQLTQASWWASPDAGDRPTRVVPPDPAGDVTRLLGECVAARMGPSSGVLLSGGAASAAVLGLMSRQSGQAVDSFAVGCVEDLANGLPAARLVAERFAANHHELVVSAEDLLADLPALSARADAPLGAARDVALHRLARLAGRSVRSVLTGTGAGEVLGGRARHRSEGVAAFYRRAIPAPLHRRLVERMGSARLGVLALTEPSQRLPAWSAPLPPAEAAKLAAFEVPERALDPRLFRVTRRQSPLRRVLFFEQTSLLPDHALERAERIAMAAGVEPRAPFLDHRLVQYCSRLPDAMRQRGRGWLFGRAMAGVLPPQVLERRERPDDGWSGKALRPLAGELLLGAGSATRDWYQPERLARLVEQPGNDRALWLLVALELFQRHHKLR